MKTRQNLFRLDKIYIDQTKSIKTRQNIFKRCGGSFNILLNFVKKLPDEEFAVIDPPPISIGQNKEDCSKVIKKTKNMELHGPNLHLQF